MNNIDKCARIKLSIRIKSKFTKILNFGNKKVNKVIG